MRACGRRAQGGSRIGREPADQDRGGELLRQRMRLAGPEVQLVRVAALAGGRAQRRRDVVDVGVAERRVARRARAGSR